ncbi:MAG: hypothetical protein Q8K32_15075 [Archangium sp.]|nr:hypothetical protein [Archangium sp.]
MREDQIVRYGRQILLREVGGKGQEKLLVSPVRVWGSSAAIDDALAWLAAGGTPIERTSDHALSGFFAHTPLEPSALTPVLDLLPRALASTAPTQVVVGAGVAYRTAAACDACWEKVRLTLGCEPPGGPVGSLAALTAQRLILGWSDALGIVHWRGDRFETGAVPACSHVPKSTAITST